jgi:2-polyprenyl-6-methoxyphenol hydroxylase-like FAD-dependent oxidoreductase
MKRILISGGGIAGPALAWWLHRFGIESTLVEAAPALRTGGQAVDFRGPVHRQALERMGLWSEIHARRTPASALDVLTADGRPFATLPAYMFGGDVEITRGDLSALLYERTRTSTDYRFGDQITALDDDGERVHAQFRKAPPEAFDLVVGADGLHSGVRSIHFGAETQYLRHQGYRIVSFDMSDAILGERGLLWSARGLGVTLSRTRTGARASMFFCGEPLPQRGNGAADRQSVHRAFANAGWQIPRFLEALYAALEVYLDAITLVVIERYARGRVVLLGDAAWGGTLGGQGTPLAIVGACVLASALAAEPNVSAALSAYEQKMRPYATRGQQGARHVGGFHAPRTALALALRNAWLWTFTRRPLGRVLKRIVTQRADNFLLPATA